MTAEGRLARREDLEPLSVRGRAAGITTGSCAVLAGLVLMWAAWDALTCPLSGEEGTAICNRSAGLGGLIEMFALGLFVSGCAILWRTGRRLVTEDGLSGWTWGEGIAIAASGLTIGLLIPTFHCPAGYQLTAVFHVCRGATMTPEIIVHPPTWLGWKVGAVAAGIVVGIVVARWRRLPWPVASVVTIAAVGGATWYLADKAIGLSLF